MILFSCANNWVYCQFLNSKKYEFVVVVFYFVVYFIVLCPWRGWKRSWEQRLQVLLTPIWGPKWRSHHLFIHLFHFPLQGQQINEAACDLAREVANEGDGLVAGGVSQTPSYLSCKCENDVKAIFKKQIDVFIKKNVDFLIAEVCGKYSDIFVLTFKATIEKIIIYIQIYFI